MNLRASQPEQAEQPRAATMKFTYPSGARPLDGYTIKRGVGRGGFGEVYFGTSDAGKEVALKLIRRNLDVELRGVRQCLNLKHPNLIGLYDIRSDDVDDQWVVMEYVSGESLEDAIDRHPDGMPVDQALAWIRGICAGVAYLHDHGIVHRDLKPGNIFLDEGTVKIGDYGLAKFISCSRRSGQTESVGTVHYMAPEIANGRYGREIDTYALGIILYEMLTGHVPFEGESVGEVLMKHLTAEPDLGSLQQPYQDIVRRALAKDPDHRLSSVQEMVALLPAGEGAAAFEHIPLIEEPAPSPGAGNRPQPNKTKGAAAGGQPGVQSAASPAGANAPAASQSLEEPVWKAVREASTTIWERFTDPQTPTVLRVVVVLAIVFVFIRGPQYFIGILFPALVCYGIYYVLWVNFIRPDAQRRTDPSGGKKRRPGVPPEARSTALWNPSHGEDWHDRRRSHGVARRRPRTSWREYATLQLVAKPLREKLAELLGSMLLAAWIATLIALVAPFVMGIDDPAQQNAMHLWFAVVGTLASWAVLIPSKFVEGRLEDQIPMRMLLLVLGGAVGLAAWQLDTAMLLDVPSGSDPVEASYGLISHELFNWERPAGDGSISLAVYATYFAFLFVLVRWWRLAEYTRGSRLSLWTLFVCVFWAWVLHFFWWFPQPLGMLTAGLMATAVQLSSPWLPPSRRRALQFEADAAAELKPSA